MGSTTMNQLLVKLGAPDQYMQGERWQPWIQRFYTGLALYDPAIDWLFPDYRRAGQDLLDALALAPEHRVLDLGCGTGLLTLPAAQRARFVVGIDLTEAMLERLRRRADAELLPRVGLIQGDVRFLPLVDGSFQRVVTSFMLLHLAWEEKRQALREAARVLVPGGRLGCLTGLHRLARVYLTRAEWQELLEEAGFQDVTFQERYGAFRLVLARTPG